MNRRQFFRTGLWGAVAVTAVNTSSSGTGSHAEAAPLPSRGADYDDMLATTPYRDLIGQRWDVPLQRTPLGLYLDTGGFEEPRWKRERKSENWLLANGVPQEIVHADPLAYYDENAPDFYRWCVRLWSHVDQLVEWTDEAWLSGKREGPLVIQVEPTPFWVPEAQQWRTAWRYSDTWRVCIVHVSLTDDGVHARVRTYRNELAWAFSNL